MDFDLSEEQRMLQETVRRFCEDEAPITRLLQLYNKDERLDRGLWAGMAGLGLTGIVVPEEFGGAGLEFLDLAVVAETLGYCALPGPFLGHSLATLAIALGGSAEQKQKWLPKLASGALVASFAADEAPDRWQPEQWSVKAERGTLSGEKKNVLHVADVDLFVVGVEGGGLALVERGAAGLETREVDGIDRTRRIGWLHMKQASGEMLERGKDAAARVYDAALILLAADAYGGAWRCVEFTVDYAKTREQFGKTIGHFQGVKHQIADMAADVRPSQALHWYAAYAFDHRPKDASRMAALAKSHITERFVIASRKMVELHGGVGYTWDFYCQIWVKRAMFDRAYFGSPAFHRERAAVMAGW